MSSLAGTVLDDISKNRTCVHLEQCPCTLNGETYAPGDTMKAACRTWWVATSSLEKVGKISIKQIFTVSFWQSQQTKLPNQSWKLCLNYVTENNYMRQYFLNFESILNVEKLYGVNSLAIVILINKTDNK